jgi:hypothetical protein
VEAVSSILNLRIYHAVVTRDPLNMDRFIIAKLIAAQISQRTNQQIIVQDTLSGNYMSGNVPKKNN